MLRVKDVLAWVGAAALGGLVAAPLLGAAQQRANRLGTFKVVEAESFVLRDRPGVARGRFEWRADTEESLISLMDKKGIKHFSSVLRADGSVAVTLGGDADDGRITLARGADGEATLTCSHRQSQVVIVSRANGLSAITLEDQLRTRRASLGLTDDGSPRLELMDAEGKATFRAPARD